MEANDLQKLVDTEMPYGKFKGRKSSDLPGNYLNWFARCGFPKGEIREKIGGPGPHGCSGERSANCHFDDREKSSSKDSSLVLGMTGQPLE